MSGIDPRDYALKLSLATQEATDVKGFVDPVQVMKYGANIARKVVGSATACIVTLQSSELFAANLGDSGFLIVRPSKDNKSVQLIFKSEEQQHSFNFPYQLGNSSSDRPEDADLYKLAVEDGDLVILGTDGLFDNIDEKYICRLVAAAIAGTEGGAQNLKIAPLARFIAAEAFKVSQDPNARTPFEIASRRRFTGGKPDDITVLISRVRSNANQTEDSSLSSTTASKTVKSTTQKTSAPETGKTSSSTTTHKMITPSEADIIALRQLDASPIFDSEAEEEKVAEEELQPWFLQRVLGLRPWTFSSARL